MKEIHVILVDENDEPFGLMEKMEAHREGRLHRAVSVFIFNSSGEWLLQKRAHNKYHSGGLWTNATCTHPLNGETNTDAAKRRLSEEMGLQCELKELFSFIYRECLDNGMTEHEYDHVFGGITDEDPVINNEEVQDWRRICFSDLENEIINHPDDYTVWFKKIFRKVRLHLINSGEVPETGKKI